MAHTVSTLKTRTNSSNNPITDNTFGLTNYETVIVLMIKTVGGTNRAGGAPTFNCTSGNGDNYTFVQANSTQKAAASPEASCEIWYILNPKSASVNGYTLTIPNTNAASIFYTVMAGTAKRGGSSALEGSNGGNNTSTNPTPGAVTITQAGDIVFAITAGGWTTWAPSAQAGSIIANTDDGAHGGGEQYKLDPAIGSYTLNWTFGTSDDWGAVVVAFKEIDPPNFNNYMGFDADALQMSTGMSVTEKIR